MTESDFKDEKKLNELLEKFNRLQGVGAFRSNGKRGGNGSFFVTVVVPASLEGYVNNPTGKETAIAIITIGKEPDAVFKETYSSNQGIIYLNWIKEIQSLGIKNLEEFYNKVVGLIEKYKAKFVPIPVGQ